MILSVKERAYKMNNEGEVMDMKVVKHITVILLVMVFIIAGCNSNNTSQTTNTTSTNNTNSVQGNSGDSSQTTNQEGAEQPQSPIELSYWSVLNNTASASVSHLGEVLLYQELEKRSNIKINFTHPSSSGVDEQFNLLIVSRDLPDIIEYDWLSKYNGGPAKAISDSIIIPLNDLINEHAPNIKKYFDENQDVLKDISTDSGVIYTVPSVAKSQIVANSGLMLRKDWLDELQLEVPETLDEWEIVLQAFKDKKGAKAPLSLDVGFVNPILYAFGIEARNNGGEKFYLDNGKVKYGPMQPEFKAYLELMHAWIEKGLLDPDFMIHDRSTWQGKAINGDAGAFFGYAGSAMGNFTAAGIELNDNYELIAAPYPVLNKGEKPKLIELVPLHHPQSGGAITTANDYPVETIKWFDYVFSEEGHMLKNFGVEGLTYNLVDGYPKFTDLIMKNPEGLNFNHALGKYARANYSGPGINNDIRVAQQQYELPEQIDALTIWSQNPEEAYKRKMPNASATPEEAQEIARLTSEINTYQEEMTLRFIMGNDPIANFDRYVERLESLGVGRLVELRQAQVDRYTNR